MLELPNVAVETFLATMARHATANVQGDVMRVALDMDGCVWCLAQDDPEHAPDWREFTGLNWELASFDPDPQSWVAVAVFQPARWVLGDVADVAE